LDTVTLKLMAKTVHGFFMFLVEAPPDIRTSFIDLVMSAIGALVNVHLPCLTCGADVTHVLANDDERVSCSLPTRIEGSSLTSTLHQAILREQFYF